MNPGDRVELRVESLAAGGDGVGRHRGRVVFVPLAAPGDRLEVSVEAVRPRYARARIERVLDPGPGRREAPCPYFGRCGGCTWMHLEEDVQAEARRDILLQALVRIGRRTELPPIEWIPSPRALGYRARAKVAFENGRVGFRAARSREVVDVERCAVLDGATQRELAALRASRPAGTGEMELRGFGSRAAGLRVGPGAFFQANAPLWESWRNAVVDACGEGELLVELYAGVGFYTVGLEPRFERVIAVERGRAAHDLRQNTRASVRHGSAESFALGELAELTPQVVLLNPPREGCDKMVLDAVCRALPQRVVYVSCEPATLSRDLTRFSDGYHLMRIICIDALPQTHHVETVAVLDLQTGTAST